MADVFLTGASGFVGREVHRRLQRAGHDVRFLHRGTSDRPGGVAGDLLTPSSYEHALAGRDVIVHLAAVTGKAPRTEYARVNVGGTRALIEAARRTGVGRILFCSSIAAGFPDVRNYPYAQSKAEAEQLVAGSGMKWTVIRPTIIAGPSSPVMSRLVSLAALPAIPAFGGARAMVQPILVGDLADFIVDIVTSDRFDAEVLELGGPKRLPLRDLLGHIRRQSGARPATFVPVPLGPLLPLLAVLERVAGSALPLTIGQLATFRFDGVAEPNSLWEARRAGLASIEQMITASTAA